MNNLSLKSDVSLCVKNYEGQRNIKRLKLENTSSKIFKSILNSKDNVHTFEDLCKNTAISDKKVLKMYNDVAITSKKYFFSFAKVTKN